MLADTDTLRPALERCRLARDEWVQNLRAVLEDFQAAKEDGLAKTVRLTDADTGEV